MKQLTYCSQCHNSVFFRVIPGVVVPQYLQGEKICLKCFALGKVLHRNATIGHCQHLVPEDVNKLLAGVWKPNTTDDASHRGFKRKKVNKKK